MFPEPVCPAIPWEVGDYIEIRVFADPVLGDRISQLCEAVRQLARQHRDISSLRNAVHDFAAQARVEALVIDHPLRSAWQQTMGVVSIGFTEVSTEA